MTGDEGDDAWGGETRPEASPLPAPAAAVERLGPYALTKRLGAGGMAEVYLAELARPGGFKKTLVLKRILPQLAGDAHYLEMFLREGRTSAQLSHPNVVQVFELGEVDGTYFLAMEYVEGLTLSDLARRIWFAGRPLPLAVVTACVADAALGLACAHDNSLVHRDVSPDNLMVSREGVTKVVDFGIARPQSNDRITQTGEIKGKIPYMAPEYLAGNTADPRCDTYALGVTLYWLLTGVRPFRGNSTLEEMEAIQRKAPRPPRQLNPKIPETVEALTLACLEKDPGRRPQSARAIAETLFGVTPPGRDHVATCLREAMALPQPPRGQVLKDGLPAMVTGGDATVTLAGPPANEATGATLTVNARAAPARRAVAALGSVAVVIVVATAGLLFAQREGGPVPERASSGGGEAVSPARPVSLVVPIDVADVEPVPPAASDQPLDARDAAPINVAVTAPETVRWLAPAGAPLGSGSTTLVVPAAVRGVVALDIARDVRTAIPISGRPIAYDALPRGVLDVRAPAGTQVFAGATLLGTAPLTVEVVYGAWRLRCLTGKAEERRKVTVQPGGSSVVDCGAAQAPAPAPAPPASVATPRSQVSEQRRANAKRASDGNDWLRSDGVLELHGDTLSWTPTGLSVGHQTLTLRLKDVANVSGRDQDLAVTTSWGSRYRFTVEDAAAWARAIAAGRDRFKR